MELIMDNKEKKQLISNVAVLESKVDFLEAELTYINDLLLQFGFPDGTLSLKQAIEEMLEKEDLSIHPELSQE